MLGGQLTFIILNFALTPFLIDHLGLEAYGLWALVGSVVVYLSVLDLGFGATLVRFVAAYSGAGDRHRVRHVVTSGLLLYGGIGAIVMPLAAFLVPRGVHLLHTGPDTTSLATPVILTMIGYFFVANALMGFTSVLYGLQRMVLGNVITIGGQVVYALLVVVLLQRGSGIYGLIVAMFTQSAVTGAVAFIAGRRILGRLLINPRRIDADVIRSVFRFAGWMQLNNMSNAVTIETDRVLIGGFLAVSTIAFYEVANKLALFVRYVPIAFLSALLPTAAALHASGQHELLATVHRRASRALALGTFLLAGYVAGASTLIFRFWLGQIYSDSQNILILLVITFVVNNLTGVGTTMLRATGRPRYESYYGVLGAGLNIALTLTLAPFYGLYGIVIGTVIGTVVASTFFLVLFCHVEGLSIWTEIGAWLWRLALPTAACAFAVHLVVGSLAGAAQPRGVEAAELVGVGIGYVFALTAGLRLTRFFESGDLESLGRAAPRRFNHILTCRSVRFMFRVGAATTGPVANP